MEADDGLTAVIHQASERELAKEKQRAVEREKQRERVEAGELVHWYLCAC